MQTSFIKTTKTHTHVQGFIRSTTNYAQRYLGLHDADQPFRQREQKYPSVSSKTQINEVGDFILLT